MIVEPRYRAVKRRLWTGVGQASLYAQVKALAEKWQPRKIVIDATGLGAGLASFLEAGLGRNGTVIPFVFTQKSKSDLSWAFLAVVDGGRFQDYVVSVKKAETAAEAGSDDNALQAEFVRQLSHCQMEIMPGPERRLRWGTPDGAREYAGARDDTTGSPLHDDLVISAALCAALDRMRWGRGESAVVEGRDLFEGLREVY